MQKCKETTKAEKQRPRKSAKAERYRLMDTAEAKGPKKLQCEITEESIYTT